MAIEIRDQYDKIYRYCYHKVKNAVLAEDLTQETFSHRLLILKSENNFRTCIRSQEIYVQTIFGCGLLTGKKNSRKTLWRMSPNTG